MFQGGGDIGNFLMLISENSSMFSMFVNCLMLRAIFTPTALLDLVVGGTSCSYSTIVASSSSSVTMNVWFLSELALTGSAQASSSVSSANRVLVTTFSFLS